MQFYQSEGCANALTLLADTELVLACSGGSLSVLPADARGTPELHIPVLTVRSGTAHVRVGLAPHPMEMCIRDRRIVEKALELNLDGAQVLLAEDTHSGFHGDGETRIILVLDDASSAVESILSQWPAFPAGEPLDTIFLERSGLGEDLFFPQVEQGYYSFRDRYAEQYPDDTHPLLQRFS